MKTSIVSKTGPKIGDFAGLKLWKYPTKIREKKLPFNSLAHLGAIHFLFKYLNLLDLSSLCNCFSRPCSSQKDSIIKHLQERWTQFICVIYVSYTVYIYYVCVSYHLYLYHMYYICVICVGVIQLFLLFFPMFQSTKISSGLYLIKSRNSTTSSIRAFPPQPRGGGSLGGAARIHWKWTPTVSPKNQVSRKTF